MKLTEAIESLGPSDAKSIAQEIAAEIEIPYETEAAFVFEEILRCDDSIPKPLGARTDNERDVIKKWLLKYKRGRDCRPSLRTTAPSNTTPDEVIEDILTSKMQGLDEQDLEKIYFAHKVGMSAENILGSLLEEYLYNIFRELHWHCAWGSTVKSVDFVHEDGRLLQIKNRSNSENSSSRKARDNTSIQLWYRIDSDTGVTYWGQLCDLIGVINESDRGYLSEEPFREFVRNTIAANPNCIFVDEENPWASISEEALQEDLQQ